MIRDYEELKRHIHRGHLGPLDANIPEVLINEIEALRELVLDLMVKARNAPCLASHPGEFTYNCNPEKVCRVCEWRDEVDEMLHSDWSMSDGLWSPSVELDNINKRVKE